VIFSKLPAIFSDFGQKFSFLSLIIVFFYNSMYQNESFILFFIYFFYFSVKN
jgi:hypothetical protein